MPVQVKERFFEDYIVGESRTFGDYLITEEEVREFAGRYDPQPFHVDPEAARKSHFGGLIASGWNTAAISMRLMVDGFVSGRSSLGSPGVDELRWHQPVRPGDRLKVRSTIVEARRSRSKPDRGLLRVKYETLNQRDEVVMSFTGMGLYRCRDAEPQ